MVIAIPWGHHVNLLAKIAQPAQRLYYLQATARFGWSRKVLLNQIRAQAYERSLAVGKSHNFLTVLPERLAEQAEEALKSSYKLEFLGIRQQVRERELEDRLTDRLRDFILELGSGFCFIGRQHRVTLGRNEYCAARSLDTGGVGLGLAIVRDAAAFHGGRLVQENRVGGGLRASLILPHRREEHVARSAAR